jgi:hypothetical protein
MSAGEILLWIILPYAAVATFIVGTWWRYRADQFGWTSGSTQIFEQKILGWAGPAFHYGALAAVGSSDLPSVTGWDGTPPAAIVSRIRSRTGSPSLAPIKSALRTA